MLFAILLKQTKNVEKIMAEKKVRCRSLNLMLTLKNRHFAGKNMSEARIQAKLDNTIKS